MSTAAERKAAEKAQDERIAAEEAAEQPQPTPVDEPVTGSNKTDQPVEVLVGEYPERPYRDAISERHLLFLAENHPNRLLEVGLQE